jgi:hypothetical protein
MKLSPSVFTLISSTLFYTISGNTILPDMKPCSVEGRFSCSANRSGVSSHTPESRNSLHTTLSIRGGEVLEPSTLSEVDDILLKASAEGKLVVIDFSATWVRIYVS